MASAWSDRGRSCGASTSWSAAGLLPAAGDPQRARVLDAELWGDEVLQSVPRRILDVAFLRKPAAMESFVGDTPLPLPRAVLRPALGPTRADGAQEPRPRRHRASRLAALPAQLDKVDAWIAEGLLGGERPNAADLQIGSTIRLLETVGDVRPLIAGRPAAQLTRYFPPMVGEIPTGTLPAEWLPASPNGSGS